MTKSKKIALLAAGVIALASAGCGSASSDGSLVCDDPIPNGIVPGTTLKHCKDGNGEARFYVCHDDGSCSEMFKN